MSKNDPLKYLCLTFSIADANKYGYQVAKVRDTEDSPWRTVRYTGIEADEQACSKRGITSLWEGLSPLNHRWMEYISPVPRRDSVAQPIQAKQHLG